MSVAAAFLIVLVVAIGTYVLRALPLLVLADRTLPLVVQRALRYVGPAVLAALVVVSVSATGEGWVIDPPELAALITAGVVARLTRNLIWSLTAGMGALWVLLAFGF